MVSGTFMVSSRCWTIPRYCARACCTGNLSQESPGGRQHVRADVIWSVHYAVVADLTVPASGLCGFCPDFTPAHCCSYCSPPCLLHVAARPPGHQRDLSCRRTAL